MPTIRLVIFDMGDTLMTSVPDGRVQNLTATQIDTMLDPDSMVEREGVARKLFPGVRELFDSLTKRGILISVASLNFPRAYKWFGSRYFHLNSQNLHFPCTEAGDPNSLVKGIWVERIIDLFNRYVTPGDPILNEQVLFVDDLARAHRAVSQVTPGVHCIFPTPHVEGGMLTVLEVIEELEGEEPRDPEGS